MKREIITKATLERIIKSDYFIIILLLLAFAIPYFYYKATTSFPSLPAGLYAMMAETIANKGFSLPLTIPFYGPGGIPFAYPPLALYLMAFWDTYLHSTALDYLRLAPSVFLWLSLVPMYLLGKTVTGSRLQAVLAAGLFGTSFGIIVNHYYPPGVVRGVALFFMLFCIYFGYKAFFSPKLAYAALSAFFLALTILSHLSYAVFGATSIITFGLLSKNRPFWHRLLTGLGIGIGGLVIASPWWITIISRYGPSVFLNAVNTHDNTSLLSFLDIKNFPGRLIDLLNALFVYRYETPVLIGAAILGLAVCFASKKYLLPVWLFLSILIVGGDGQRFIAIISSILGAVAVAFLLRNLPDWYWNDLRPWQRGVGNYAGVAVLAVISTWIAFILRLGSAVDYREIIPIIIIISVITKLVLTFLLRVFSKGGDIPLFNRRVAGKLFLVASTSSIFIVIVGIALFGLKSIPIRVPYSVLLLDWFISLVFLLALYGFLRRMPARDGKFFPATVFLLVFLLSGYAAQPRLFYISSEAVKNFFTNSMEMSGWIQTHVSGEATYLMVSEDESYDLPAIMRFDDEWFPYLLKRTPAVLPFGAEWTGEYGYQQALLAELRTCSQKQSLACLTDFMNGNQIHPDMLIVHRHEESYSIYGELSADKAWSLLYENQVYAIWKPASKPGMP